MNIEIMFYFGDGVIMGSNGFMHVYGR